MSSLEPVPGAIANNEPSAYGYDPNYEPPAVKKLWQRIRWLFALNTLLAFATFSQAYFAYRGNELTRAAITETVEANRLTKIALERDRLSGIEQDAKDARLITAFEKTASAAAASATAAKTSATATQQQASAAIKSTEVAERARQDSIDQRRPRVVITSVDFAIKAGTKLGVQWHFRNDGQTRALNYTQGGNFRVIGVKDTCVPDYGASTVNPRNAPLDVKGITFYPLEARDPLGAERFTAIEAGEQVVCTWVRIAYRDEFEGDGGRRFCRVYNKNTHVLAPCLDSD
jgi:hypothetical protein